MMTYSKSPVSMFTGLSRHFSLVRQLTARDIAARYRGSLFGLLWSLFLPVVMLGVYTFVFSFVFRARWNTGSDSTSEFALALFIGMIVHSVLAENISRAPQLITGNANYVKKVVFPLEVLHWSCLGTTLFHAAVSLLVWGVFFAVVNQGIQWTSVYLPLIALPLVFYSLGFSWLFSALGVYLRDIGQITGILVTLLLFLSPIFYPLSIIPGEYRLFMYLNPLTVIVEESRTVLMWGLQPDWRALAATTVISLLFCWGGYAVFQKSRRGFADVL